MVLLFFIYFKQANEKEVVVTVVGEVVAVVAVVAAVVVEVVAEAAQKEVVGAKVWVEVQGEIIETDEVKVWAVVQIEVKVEAKVAADLEIVEKTIHFNSFTFDSFNWVQPVIFGLGNKTGQFQTRTRDWLRGNFIIEAGNTNIYCISWDGKWFLQYHWHCNRQRRLYT